MFLLTFISPDSEGLIPLAVASTYEQAESLAKESHKDSVRIFGGKRRFKPFKRVYDGIWESVDDETTYRIQAVKIDVMHTEW